MTIVRVTGYHPGMDRFGRRLRALREHLELQQTAIARRVRTTEVEVKSFANYLSRLEQGEQDNPSLDMLEQIAKGMGLTLVDFFVQLERGTRTDLPEAQQSATTAGTSVPVPTFVQESRYHDPRALSAERRREYLLDIGYAILDAASRLPPDRSAREQTPAPRVRTPRSAQSHRGRR